MSSTVQTSWLQVASAAVSGTSENPAQVFGISAAFAGVDIVRVSMALALCLALGIAAIIVLRRGQRTSRMWPGRTGARRIEVVDTARLNARATLYLVEYDQRNVLLVSDASGTRLLDAHDSVTTGEARDA